MSLDAALESAHTQLGTDGGGDQPPAATQAPASTPPPEGQGTPASPGQYIGFTPDQPDTQQIATDGAGFRIAETLQPDTVVAYDGTRPITAAEVQHGYLRQADYTRKSQETADTRKQNEQAIQFFEQNKADIERLYSSDPLVRAQVLGDIAQRFQIPAPQTRQPNGQFAPAQQASQQASTASAGALNPEDWGDDAKPLVDYANGLATKLADLETKFTGFTQNLQTAQQQYAAQQEAATLASTWQGAGLREIDMAGAQKLVGQPMTATQAMQIANLDRLLRHTHAVTLAQAKAGGQMPNEAGGVNGRGNTSAAGKPFGTYVEERAHELGYGK